MSNLSPDDSAKIMMTNVSRMVETLGTVVNSLATNNANMAEETANTNNTIKQMMIQQSEDMLKQSGTMDTFMMLMTGNEVRRQEVPIQEVPIREIPIRAIQPTSTPTSTITNSQFSLSQHSTSANKQKRDGIADDDTTAASTTMIRGRFPLVPQANILLYNWDGQTLCPQTDCFFLDASLQHAVSSEVPFFCSNISTTLSS
jgi:hypothetical protein